MTTRDAFDGELTAWLEQSAGSVAADYLPETLAALGNLHQRSAWDFPRRWLPARLAGAGRVPTPLLIALLLVAMLLGLGVAGGMLRVPGPPPAPPFGLARPGLIAFDMDGRIVLANPDGSGLHQLAPGEATQFGATFSHDGRRIAFWQEDGWKSVDGVSLEKAADLWVTDVDGSHPINLTPDLEVAPGSGFPAGSWAPDGSAIAFVGDKNAPMYIVATDGSSPPRVVDVGSLLPMFPAWSPDGARIAFAGVQRLPDEVLGGSSVYVIKPDGTGKEQVSREGAGNGTGALPGWSPDGRLLLYPVDTSAPLAPGTSPVGPADQVELVTAERGLFGWTERVVTPASPIWSGALSSDGSRVAFLRRRPDMFSGDLFVVNVDGTGERMVSDRLVNVSSPCWSPDDATIAGLTGPIPPGGQDAGFGWPNQAYTLFPVAGGTPSEIPAGRVDGVFACSWQRLAP